MADDAEHAYMERFLREKYGVLTDAGNLALPGGVIDGVDAELVDESN